MMFIIGFRQTDRQTDSQTDGLQEEQQDNYTLINVLRKLAHAIYKDIFQKPKNENFIRKISIFFNVLAQNIHCGYTSEPPRRGGSDE